MLLYMNKFTSVRMLVFMIQKLSSKEYLEQSAIELLSKNTIEKVTVKDICDNCGLSTRTFYSYFKDKYEIMNTCFATYYASFFQRYEHDLTLHNMIYFSAQIVYENRFFFANMFRYTGQNNIRLGLVEPMRRQYLLLLEEYCHIKPTKEILDAITFFINGQLTFVEYALRLPEIPTAEVSLAFFENAIPAVLAPYLHLKGEINK